MRTSRSTVTAAVALLCLACAAPAARAAPLPLGTLTPNGSTAPNCPTGHTCSGFDVVCPGVQLPAGGFLGTAPAQGQARAVVVLASGGGGTGWWAGSGTPGAEFIDDLRADGFTVVQLRWATPWLASASGEDAGSAQLACRPATVYKWVHDNVYLPLGIDDPFRIGHCGFCISGNSGGATQSSYALSHYGLESLLDAVIPTSGPPHAALAKGCLRNTGQEPYWYSSGSAATIDSSNGYAAGSGPCALHDAAFAPRWDEESVDTQGSDYFHDHTRVHIILGGMDNSSAVAHAQDYAARLVAEGTPYFTSQVVPNMGHPIQGSTDGLAALGAALRHPGFESPYPRPKGATPLRVPLVPAYAACDAPNRSHGPPLAFGSCAPPRQESSYLTIGTPDSNGRAAQSTGHLRMDVLPGDPGTQANEADVTLAASMTDVRALPGLDDYGGELLFEIDMRVTDRASGPALNEPATVVDFPLSFAVACMPTADPSIGATCAAASSANAVVPGMARERRRTMWQLGAIRVLDGGPDGNGDTDDNELFARQGLFTP